MKYYMGIDVGTYESKGVIIDQLGQLIRVESAQHELDNPKPKYFEHDAEKIWWSDVCKISNALIINSGVDPHDIRALGTSALGADLLPVDKECKPLRKAILYGIDSRADEEIKVITKMYGEEKIKSIFGRPLCSSDLIPKILWVKNNEPEIYKKAYKFLTASSYITAKLTGEYVVDRFLGQSSFRPLYNIDGTPNEAECSFFCRSDQLAVCRPSTDIVGYITPQAAKETGLIVGMPVLTGTDDAGAEAISTGVLQPGDMMIMFGSSLYMIYCSDHWINDDRIWGEEFIIPNTFSVSAGTNAAGTLTRWYRDQIFIDALFNEKKYGRNAYESMIDGLENIPAGCNGLIMLPYIAGERTPINDPKASGMIFGLKINHTRSHLYRAALESIGYTIDQHFDIFKENNLKINKIMAVGGGTKNPIWMQIISDITGQEISTASTTIGASYGDALMAIIAVGDSKGYEELAQYIKSGETYKPNMKRYERYKPYRRIYDELYIRNRDLMHQLEELEAAK